MLDATQCVLILKAVPGVGANTQSFHTLGEIKSEVLLKWFLRLRGG